MIVLRGLWLTKRIVQFTQLGNFGRFGNQLFQYAFARAYAEKYDAILETPPWIGEKVFELNWTPITCSLPRTDLDTVPWGEVNIDLWGYFQTKDCFSILSTTKLLQWFTFQDKWKKFLVSTEEVIAHERKGDYESLWSDVFCSVSRDSFLYACVALGIDPELIVFLSEENPTQNTDCSDVCYSNVTNSMYGSGIYPDKGISFLPDFFRMINSKVLFRGNSSFSFWAGFFKDDGVYSPVVKGLTKLQDVSFVKGNHSAICSVTDDIFFGD